MSETMWAGVIRRWGEPDALVHGRVARPRPRRGQVLVQVEACGLNHLDILVRRGLASAVLTLPHVGGCDVVGVVRQAADQAGEALVGRRVVLDPALASGVIGAECWGGLAESVVAPAANAIPLPAVADVCRYAALPMAYGTARRMLIGRGRVQPGETVLVLGASGGVGVACVQLGALAGARVVACSNSPGKLARLKELGAHETIDLSRHRLRDRVRQLTGGEGADLVVDYLGRDTWVDSLRCAKAGGRVVTCGAITGYDPVCDLRYVWSRELTILGSNGWTGDDLRTLLGLVEAGGLVPEVHAVYPLSRVTEAMAEIEERRVCGKVIVVPDPDRR